MKGLIMSSNQRRNKRRRLYTEIDYKAKQESIAITYMKRNGNVQAKRLNKTYTCDGYRFNTGKKHRAGGNWG